MKNNPFFTPRKSGLTMSNPKSRYQKIKTMFFFHVKFKTGA